MAGLPPELARLVQTEASKRFGEAQQEYPGVLLTLESYCQRVVKAMGDTIAGGNCSSESETKAFLGDLLSRLKWNELFLTTACAEGNGTAWDIFQERYKRPIEKIAHSVAPSYSVGREIAESLLSELFLPANLSRGGPSKISQYNGSGSLEGWLRVVVSRRTIDILRDQARKVPLEDSSAGVSSGISRRSAAQTPPEADAKTASLWFEQSLNQAFERLTVQERLVLKMYYLQNVNLKEIGRMLQVHESTVSRLIQRLNSQLRKDVEKQLRTAWGVKPSEVSHVIHLAYAHSEVDLSTMLRE
ncbi:MAG: sigma-70 family RNA polymerase sigma factor [Acidobacteriota bacterium]